MRFLSVFFRSPFFRYLSGEVMTESGKIWMGRQAFFRASIRRTSSRMGTSG